MPCASRTSGTRGLPGPPPDPVEFKSKPSNPTHANRSSLPDPLRRSAVALPVVPHPDGSGEDGRLLPLLWVTLPHRPVIPGAV